MANGGGANDDIFEFDVYDLTNNTAVGAWSVDFGNSSLGPGCTVEPWPTPHGVALLAEDLRVKNSLTYYSAWGTPAVALNDPSVVRFGGLELLGVQNVGASDTTLAFDINGASAVRLPIGSLSYVQATGTPGLLFAFVNGDDTFFESEYGNNGWGQIWRLDASGSAILIRERTGRHVFSPATDGQTLFWVEAYGPNPNLSQPMDAVEVWASAYSTDPAAINAGAHMLASFPSARVPANPIAFLGTYLMNTGSWHAIRTDGTVSTVPSPDPNLYLHEGFYVDEAEMWSFASVYNGFPNIAVMRIPLPPFH